MKKIITIDLTKDINYNKSFIIGHSGENNVTEIELILKEEMTQYNVYLDFKLPNGEKFKTKKLNITDKVAKYDVSKFILKNDGIIIFQVVLQNDNEIIWKSNNFQGIILYSVNADEEIPNDKVMIMQEVNEFPKNNVEKNKIYVVENYDVLIKTEEIMFLSELTYVEYYIVEELPESPKISDLSSLKELYIYIYNDTAYAYGDLGEGNKYITIGQFFELMGMPLPDKGYIEDISMANDMGIYIINLTSYGLYTNGQIYKYDSGNNSWIDYEKQLKGLIDKTLSYFYCPSSMKSIPENTFKFFQQLKYVYNTDNIIDVGQSAFQNCAQLSSISFPNVKMISESTFSNCTMLIEVNLPQVQAIYQYAFSNCSKLEYIYLPSVIDIWGGAFQGCMNLTNIYLGYEGVVRIVSDPFVNGASNTVVHVRSEYANQYATATNWSSLIESGRITIVGDYND